MFKDSPQGTTHFYGDSCSPPHRCPEGTCQRAYNGVCKVCNQEMHQCCDGECYHDDCCGKVISFGWNTAGIGKTRGFEIKRTLIVPHGGSKNDTLCTVEIKL